MLLVVPLLTLLAQLPATAQVTIENIVVTGDAAPGDLGNFRSFLGYATLNTAGQVGFLSFLDTPIGGHTFRADAAGNIALLAHYRQPLPDGNGSIGFWPSIPTLNSSGLAVSRASISCACDSTSGIFLSGSSENIVQVARIGQSTPNDSSTFYDFAFPLLINDMGQTVFLSRLSDANGSTNDGYGIYRGDGVSGLEQIARTGQATPDNIGSFDFFYTPDINDLGHVAFLVTLDGSSNGIFLDRGVNGLSQIARSGQPIPGSNGSLRSFSIPSLNNEGHIAFVASIFNPTDNSTGDQGIFLSDYSSNLVQLTHSGQTTPNNDGSFAEFYNATINEAGQIMFTGRISDTQDGNDYRGIFRIDIDGKLTQIVRSGQAALDNNGSIAALSLYSIPSFNSAGQIAFTASLRGTSGGRDDDEAIYAYDDQLGLIQVIRKGDSYLNSTITRLSFENTGEGELAFWRRKGADNFNDTGQIVFNFTLANGRSGIALATIVPEPSTLLLITIASSAQLLRQRRRPACA